MNGNKESEREVPFSLFLRFRWAVVFNFLSPHSSSSSFPLPCSVILLHTFRVLLPLSIAIFTITGVLFFGSDPLMEVLSEEQFLPKMDWTSLNNTLEKLVIKVAPMENLNGRKIVEDGDLCDRRNGRGVDLNRNWSVDWGKKEKDYDPYEENPGTGPFSEPETQLIRKLCII